MSSLVTNLNSSTASQHGNCKLGHDCRRVRSHRRYVATRLGYWQICSDSWRLSPTSSEFRTHRRRDSTRHLSRVGVGGVYWALTGAQKLTSSQLSQPSRTKQNIDERKNPMNKKTTINGLVFCVGGTELTSSQSVVGKICESGNYTVSQKHATILSSISSPNIDRF